MLVAMMNGGDGPMLRSAAISPGRDDGGAPAGRPSRWRPMPGLGHVRLDHADRHRLLTALAAVGLLAAVLLAVFGMPPVDLHGPTHWIGIMGPTCGMTRGVAATAGGDLARAVAYNPASPLVVAGAMAAVLRWVVGRATGRWLTFHLHVSRRGWIAILLGLALLTVNQQLHADLLVAG